MKKKSGRKSWGQASGSGVEIHFVNQVTEMKILCARCAHMRVD